VSSALAYTMMGLGVGGFFAMLAAGIVVAFKGSGVINFAHGAIAMFAAYEFNLLRTKGILVLPWVDILPTKALNLPVKIKLSSEKLGVPAAMIIALLISVLIGALAHFLVFRPLRNAAPLGKVIGSVGLMLYLQGVALKNFGTSNANPTEVLPGGLIHNFLGLGKPLSKEALWYAVVAVVVGIVIWAVYRFTRFGLATRAAAGNEKGASLLGYSPESLALSNWVISAFLAGLAGVLSGTLTGALDPVKYTSLLIPALGAALIGGLSSVPLAVAGGLAMGMLQTFSTTWLAARPWFPHWMSGAVKDALPLLVIAIVLFARGKSLPTRGTVEEKRLPLSPNPVRVLPWTIIGGGAAIIGGFIFTGFWAFAFTTTLIGSMLMLGYVVLTGYVGQISLAQLSIAGVAAFFMARMMADGSVSPAQPFPVSGPHLPWPIAGVLGIVVAVIVGVLIGLPALRIRGVQLAVVSIAAAVALQTLYFENQQLTDLSAGSNAAVSYPTLFGINIGSAGDKGLTDRPAFTVFCVVVLALLCVAVCNIRIGGTGRRFLAVRANERAAAAAGIEVARTKMLAFAVASAIAGVAGVMTAFQQGQISSSGWVYFGGLAFLAFAYLGGITSVNGALVGGMLIGSGLVSVFSNYHFAGLLNYVTIIGGIGMILTAIQNPQGIAPTLQPLFQYFGRWVRHATVADWVTAIKRVLPGALVGMAIMTFWLYMKANEFRLWHIPLVILFGLFLRGIALQIKLAITTKRQQRASLAAEMAMDGSSPVAATGVAR